MRFRMLAAVLTGALALSAAPASADEHEDVIVGVNIGISGTVAGYHVEEEQTLTVKGPKYQVAGQCTFAGVLTPNNTLIVEFAGTATATGPANGVNALLTAIECEINNHSESGTNSQARSFSLNGPQTAVADSTLTSSTPEWPVKDITVCVSAFAIFGPTPVHISRLAKACQTPA